MSEFFAQPDDLGEGLASDLHTSLGEQLGARAGEAFMGGVRTIGRGLQYQYAEHPELVPPIDDPTAALLYQRQQAELPQQPDVSIDDARARVKQEGLEGHLKLPEQPTIRQPVLDLMVQHAHERRQYEAAVQRGPQGFIPDALGMATEIGVGMIDPVNAAAFSIPVVGEARMGKMMLGAGDSVLGRTGLRLAAGAAQGAVGTAALQPAEWWLHTKDGQDYTFGDALRSVVLGAGMGAAAHAGIGGIGDVLARVRGRPLPGTQADLELRSLAGDVQAAQELEHAGPRPLPEDIEGEPPAEEEVPGIATPHPPARAAVAATIEDVAREMSAAAGRPEARAEDGPRLPLPADHPASVMADLPPRVREDVVRSAIADVIQGNEVRAGEMLQEAAKEEPRIAETFHNAVAAADTVAGRIESLRAAAAAEGDHPAGQLYRDRADALEAWQNGYHEAEPHPLDHDVMGLRPPPEPARPNIGPQNAALLGAYMRARESGPKGRGRVGFEGVDLLTPTEQKFRTSLERFPGKQRADARAIFQHVVDQYHRAGLPYEEAEHAGAIVASRYVTRAQRLGGKKSPLDLYRAEGIELRRGEGLALEGVSFDQRAARVWTEQQVAHIREGVAEGRSSYRMADELGVSQMTVLRKISDLGLKSTARGGGFKPGVPRGPSPLKGRVGGREWTEADLARFRALREARTPVAEIAESFGVSKFAIQRVITRAADLDRYYSRAEWSADQIATLRRGIADGFNLTRIAGQLDLHPRVVQLKARELGITPASEANAGAASRAPVTLPRLGFLERPEVGTELDQAERGRITLSEGSAIVQIFAKGDRSTFMHEMGHLWLDELVRDAAAAPEGHQLKADLAAVLKWLGADSPEKIGREQHEQWARGFEQYLAEGKAPSTALQRAFDVFKSWLYEIYRSLKDLGTSLSDDVRGVMDRLIDSDKEIATRDRLHARRMEEAHSAVSEAATSPIAALVSPPAGAPAPAAQTPEERAAAAGAPRQGEIVRAGRPQVDAVLADPVVAEAIRNPKIDRDHDVPYEAGASEGADTTTHLDRRLPEVAELPGGRSFDPAIPANIHEQVEKRAMELMIARLREAEGREPNAKEMERIYETAHHEYAEPAEDAWYRAQGLDIREVNAWWARQDKITEHENPVNPPPDLYRKPYPHNVVEGVKRETGGSAAEWATTTPVEGVTRFYHGGSAESAPASGGGRWVTPDLEYARGYARPGGEVHYVDIRNDHPLLRKSFDDTGTDQRAPFVSFEAPEEIARHLRLFETQPGTAPARADWQRLAAARNPDNEDLAAASRQVDRTPEPQSIDPAKAPSAAAAAAAEADKLLAELLPRLSEAERRVFEDRLGALSSEQAAREQLIRDGTACLLEAVA